MKIPKDALFSLSRRGYLTLQIPDITISFEDIEEEMIDVLPVHFERLSGAVPKKQGFLFFSQEGWEHYKDQIKQAYDEAVKDGIARGTWNDFVDAANMHFIHRSVAIEKEKKKLRKKLAELEALK